MNLTMPSFSPDEYYVEPGHSQKGFYSMHINAFQDIQKLIHPGYKKELADANLVLEGVNPSCGDDIWLQLKVENDVITDRTFKRDGCSISQASADMMLDLIIGRCKDDVIKLSDIFLKMIKNKATEDEIDKLEEVGVLQDISHMSARVKCAVLGWRTMSEMLYNNPN